MILNSFLFKIYFLWFFSFMTIFCHLLAASLFLLKEKFPLAIFLFLDRILYCCSPEDGKNIFNNRTFKITKYINIYCIDGLMRFIKITIIRTRKPERDNINEELQYLGYSLGLFSERDKDKSCFRIFIILLKALKSDTKLTSDEIASLTNLTRGTVIHHLNRLMEANIVVNEKSHYVLAVDNLEELVELARGNINKTIDTLKGVAKAIDKKLGL